jgi:hypothetical protein
MDALVKMLTGVDGSCRSAGCLARPPRTVTLRNSVIAAFESDNLGRLTIRRENLTRPK